MTQIYIYRKIKGVQDEVLLQQDIDKLVKGLKHKPYAERLAWLNTTSFEKRRIRGDLIQVFHILKGFDSVDANHFFELEDGGRYVPRGHRLKLKVQRCRLQVRQNFFSVRIVNLWNKLPESIVESSSVNVFKKLEFRCGLLKLCFSSTTSQVTRYD